MGGYVIEDFWELVTGYRDYKEYRTRSIKHPVIRCIQRALAQTIFAHGDDIEEVTIEEMKLLDHMLAPESRLERPDLMLLMEKYWMRVRDETKEGGIITCTTFPTAIAYMLKIDILGYLTIPCAPRFDLESMIDCRFICKALGNGPLDPNVYL
jgi:ATHILA ORF-1 family